MHTASVAGPRKAYRVPYSDSPGMTTAQHPLVPVLFGALKGAVKGAMSQFGSQEADSEEPQGSLRTYQPGDQAVSPGFRPMLPTQPAPMVPGAGVPRTMPASMALSDRPKPPSRLSYFASGRGV